MCFFLQSTLPESCLVTPQFWIKQILPLQNDWWGWLMIPDYKVRPLKENIQGNVIRWFINIWRVCVTYLSDLIFKQPHLSSFLGTKMDDILCFVNMLDFCLKMVWMVVLSLENSFKSLSRDSSSSLSESIISLCIFAKMTRMEYLLKDVFFHKGFITYRNRICKVGLKLTFLYWFRNDCNLKIR